MNEESYDDLKQFIMCYFNQDMDLDHGSWQEATGQYAKDCSYKELRKTREELADILCTSKDDAELMRKVRFDREMAYGPLLDGYQTYRAWLIDLAKKMDDAIAKKQQE